jgi:hypothetical protein
MPIEIRELVIKAIVQQDRGAGAAAAGSGTGGDNDVKPDEELLKKSVDKITQILKERHER